jgi:histidinol-phosphate/aromatic aminotransferase/cobyric acid decarboxylase-like protein
MNKPTKAVHGGAFFGAIGESLRTLDRADDVISADVLDAWYEPSPRVLAAIEAHLPFLIKTSPPTHGEGLREVIAEVRGIKPENILLGAGTSSLMFLTLPQIIKPGDKVLVLDPSYGEYAHIVENVIGAELVRFELPFPNLEPNLGDLMAAARNVDVAILVNPNSPTGQVIDQVAMNHVAWECPGTLFWIDETYIDFYSNQFDRSLSSEASVAYTPNVIVSKSMSKYYGLSGLRVGYLVADTKFISEWERFSPPWSVGLIGQLGAIEALNDEEYYKVRSAETRELRAELAEGLSKFGWHVVPSVTNYLMAQLPERGVDHLCEKLAEQDIFIRNCDSLSPRINDDWVRIAVKDQAANRRILAAIEALL